MLIAVGIIFLAVLLLVGIVIMLSPKDSLDTMSDTSSAGKQRTRK